MSEDIMVGVLSGNFGDEIHPRVLVDALQQYGFIRLNDSRVKITILKEFTVYGVTWPQKWPGSSHIISATYLESAYYNMMNNIHLYER